MGSAGSGVGVGAGVTTGSAVSSGAAVSVTAGAALGAGVTVVSAAGVLFHGWKTTSSTIAAITRRTITGISMRDKRPDAGLLRPLGMEIHLYLSAANAASAS